MADAERSAERWWVAAPSGRVVQLHGASFDLLRLSLDPLPDEAPAVLTYQPHGSGAVASMIATLLDDLDRAAADLFPLWLPDARNIAGPQGASVTAVRALAFELAATSNHFGPFLADLAERSLRRDRTAAGFAPVVIAAGLGRVISASYERDAVALLVEVPEGLDADTERAMVATAEWLAHHGGWGVWLAGAPLRTVDRVETLVVRLSPELTALARELPVDEPTPDAEPGVSILGIPPVSGVPRADSAAETRLESVLRNHHWAIGRTWNTTYQSRALAMSIRLDLWWAAERCVVEIDGPEHRGALHYAADRQRDVLLQLDGYAVLRFTNAQVLDDTWSVVSQIERFIRGRRSKSQEKSRDVNR